MQLEINKTKSEVHHELVEFINENAEDFSKWLWIEVPKLLNASGESKSSPKENLLEAEDSKPKVKSAVVIKRKSTAEDLQNSRQQIWNNSINLMRKAIGDTQKRATIQNTRNVNKNGISSFIIKNKDGK